MPIVEKIAPAVKSLKQVIVFCGRADLPDSKLPESRHFLLLNVSLAQKRLPRNIAENAAMSAIHINEFQQCLLA